MSLPFWFARRNRSLCFQVNLIPAKRKAFGVRPSASLCEQHDCYSQVRWGIGQDALFFFERKHALCWTFPPLVEVFHSEAGFSVRYFRLTAYSNSRRPIHIAVTANPMAEWTTRQLLEAFPWDSAPRYLLRDRDACYGEEFHKATGWLGHSRSSHGSAIALAKSLCRALDRHDSPRVLGPRHRPA